MKLIFITNTYGGWEGVFMNGKLDYEGHSIPTYKWLDYMRLQGIKEVEELQVDGEWMEWVSSFPELLDDIPREKFIND